MKTNDLKGYETETKIFHVLAFYTKSLVCNHLHILLKNKNKSVGILDVRNLCPLAFWACKVNTNSNWQLLEGTELWKFYVSYVKL